VTRPIRLAFLWHMHQPGYLNLKESTLELPWVRLHSAKAYFDMPWMLERHPGIQCTINFVPILLEQINHYLNGMRDVYFQLSLKPTSTLTRSEKRTILAKFFSCNFDTCVAPRPRFIELHQLAQTENAIDLFCDQDFLDLTVLFNLSWFGYGTRIEYPLINALETKGTKFNEDEKLKVLDLQIAAMRRLFPMYRRLIDRGQIEVSTTPYHHPILPLIIDSQSMARCMPDATQPQRFECLDDARRQVSLAVQAHETIFRHPPEGMWPAEGSVSPETLRLFDEFNLKWAVTDETILWRSFGDRHAVRGALYQPYQLNSSKTTLFFRDRDLSDAVGFRYARMETGSAIDSFLKQVRDIRSMTDDSKSPLVVVALDGENPWEYYQNNGKDFLEGLYNHLEDAVDIDTVRLCDSTTPARPLLQLATGSWIDGDFGVWIGGVIENMAWGLLGRARAMLESQIESAPPDAIERAQRMLLRAQSSDWFWWYGDRFKSADDADFDTLFRGLLRGAYQTLEVPVPADVDQPLVSKVIKTEVHAPLALISPNFTALATPLVDWSDAGRYTATTGSMALGTRHFGTIFFGFDDSRLFFRVLTLDSSGLDRHRAAKLTCFLAESCGLEVIVEPSGTTCPTGSRHFARFTNEAIEGFVSIVEADLNAGTSIRMNFTISLSEDQFERVPLQGDICAEVPDSLFSARHWSV
jgi:alpha-amylase/alpha-mannosidase (GH57 family)